MTEQSAIEILESISDAVLVIDEHGRYTYVNTAAERLSGRRHEELLGRARLEVFPGLIGTPFDSTSITRHSTSGWQRPCALRRAVWFY